MSNQVRKSSFDIKLFSLVILMVQGILISQDLSAEGGLTKPIAEAEFILPLTEDVKKCAKDFRNCDKLNYYPSDIARQLVLEGKADRSFVTHKTGIDTNTSEEVKPRFDDSETKLQKFCPSFRQLVFPKAVYDPYGNATFIVQVPELDFNQGIRTEVCDRKTDNACGEEMRRSVPTYMKLKCIQKYSHKTFITFNTTSRTANVPILIPSCCLCGYDY